MKKNLTELVFILDCSGSMAGLENDTIGGFNAMLKRQRGKTGEAYVTTVLFANDMRIVNDRQTIDRVEPLDSRKYRVGGCTALYDAVGLTVDHIAHIHRYSRKEDRPEKTVFVITTDGMENASRKYTLQQVKQKIDEEKKKYGWEFIFLGANIDAESVAEDMGIDRTNAVNYCCDSEGTAVNFEAVGAAISSVRETKNLDPRWRMPIDRDYTQRKR